MSILMLSAVGVHVLPELIGVHLRKEPVPLRKPLHLFDVRRVGPRYVRDSYNDQMPPMSEDMVESLGTEEYLRLYLTDTQRPATDPARVASVFITYYTGQPDMVPHVPDECYLASGYDPLGISVEMVHVAGVGAPNDEVPVRVVRFQAPQQRRQTGAADEVAVLYFFHVNGGYATSRNGVRVILSNPIQRYAYFSKIEVTFTDGRIVRSAGPEESLAALGPLLEAVLPALFDEHFDLGKFTSAEAADTRSRK